MKVKLIGYPLLKRALELEGDEIVETGEDLLLDERVEGPIPFLESLGIEISKNEEESFRVIKWFSNNEFSPQTMIGIPFPSIMNDNLGKNLEVGLACRYYDKDNFDDVLPKLKNVLVEMNYRGFISLSLSATKKIIGASLGAGIGLCNVLEGVRCKISEFLLHGEDVLESWTVSLVVSRYPFPMERKGERLFLDISPSAEKHIWFYEIEQHRKSFFTDSTKVCVVTAWANSVNEVARRVLRTCRGLNIKMAQYRTDVNNYVSTQWTLYETILR